MNVVVRKSGIHGKGVFAVHDFRKGETVIRWNGKILTEEEVRRLSASKKRYVSCSDKGKWILFGSPAKFVNHSCRPNTKAVNGRDVATRNIRKDEEITANYIAEKVPGLNMKCRCGSEKCRGIIRTKD